MESNFEQKNKFKILMSLKIIINENFMHLYDEDSRQEI